jgi:hypothetical protein
VADKHTMTDSSYSAPASLSGLQRVALVVGVAGLAICAFGFTASREQFFRAWLMAYMVWFGVALGSMAWLMIQHLSGGAWGVVTRRIFEASSRTLPFMAILFVPVALGVHDLYLWSRPEFAAHDEISRHRTVYLNVPFFYLRAAIYFVVWSAMAYLLSSWSRQQDQTPDDALALRMQRLSGAGLVIYSITLFFAAVDWVMSLDPHWFSTIYGILFMGGQGLGSMAFTIAIVVLLSRTEPMSRIFGPNHLHDLGKLMLAFVMLWAYFQFSQFLIIWSANLPEEIPFYLTRMKEGWQWVSILLIVGHFVLPFLLLLNRDLKRSNGVATLAVFVIVMRFVDLFWLIGPPHGTEALRVHWLDFVTPFAIGGVFVGLFLWQLASRPLLPLGEPALAEAIEQGHGH